MRESGYFCIEKRQNRNENVLLHSPPQRIASINCNEIHFSIRIGRCLHAIAHFNRIFIVFFFFLSLYPSMDYLQFFPGVYIRRRWLKLKYNHSPSERVFVCWPPPHHTTTLRLHRPLSMNENRCRRQSSIHERKQWVESQQPSSAVELAKMSPNWLKRFWKHVWLDP